MCKGSIFGPFLEGLLSISHDCLVDDAIHHNLPQSTKALRDDTVHRRPRPAGMAADPEGKSDTCGCYSQPTRLFECHTATATATRQPMTGWDLARVLPCPSGGGTMSPSSGFVKRLHGAASCPFACSCGGGGCGRGGSFLHGPRWSGVAGATARTTTILWLAERPLRGLRRHRGIGHGEVPLLLHRLAFKTM